MTVFFRIAASVFVMGMALCATIVVEGFIYQGAIAKHLECDLGFGHAGTYIRSGNSAIGPLSITGIVPGGRFDQAGFQNGDIVIGQSATGFFKLLHKSRGQSVEIFVVDGGDGAILKERNKRRVLLTVPKSSETQTVSNRD
jgi:hypothetical protein